MKPYRYDLVVFDLDGTLLDTSKGILGALCQTLRELGFEDTDRVDLTSFIGPPIEEAFRRLLGLRGEALAHAAARFRQYYRTKYLKKATPYTGMMALLEVLGTLNIKTAVATYKREDYAKELLEYLGLSARIPILFGSDAAGLFQKSDLIRRCLLASGISNPTRAVMVGDTLEDARGAKDARVDFIAVTYGFGFQNHKEAAVHATAGVADTPMGILPHVIGQKEDLNARSGLYR